MCASSWMKIVSICSADSPENIPTGTSTIGFIHPMTIGVCTCVDWASVTRRLMPSWCANADKRLAHSLLTISASDFKEDKYHHPLTIRMETNTVPAIQQSMNICMFDDTKS